jgi:hypothetical protein
MILNTVRQTTRANNSKQTYSNSCSVSLQDGESNDQMDSQQVESIRYYNEGLPLFYRLLQRHVGVTRKLPKSIGGLNRIAWPPLDSRVDEWPH